jgi:hypothetical protein
MAASSGASATATSAPPTNQTAPIPELSVEIRRDTAVLEAASEGAPGGRARAYVLGVSHVSRESCEEAAELIRAVRPDVVVLELCKDRLRLLLDQVAFSSLALAHPICSFHTQSGACFSCLRHHLIFLGLKMHHALLIHQKSCPVQFSLPCSVLQYSVRVLTETELNIGLHGLVKPWFKGSFWGFRDGACL